MQGEGEKIAKSRLSPCFFAIQLREPTHPLKAFGSHRGFFTPVAVTKSTFIYYTPIWDGVPYIGKHFWVEAGAPLCESHVQNKPIHERLQNQR